MYTNIRDAKLKKESLLEEYNSICRELTQIFARDLKDKSTMSRQMLKLLDRKDLLQKK